MLWMTRSKEKPAAKVSAGRGRGAWRATVGALTLVATVGAGMADTPLRVAVVTAAKATALSTISLTGEIVARDTLTASFPTGGRISQVLVDTGDRVAKGDVLARIEQVQQAQTLRAAQAGLTSARANHLKAQEDSERQDGLLKRGATTRSARDAAADQLRAAQALEAQALADLDRAKKALTDTELLAPSAATVTDRMAEPGQVVGAAQPVMELALGDRYDAIFHVPEAALTKGSQEGDILLSALSRPEVTVIGKVRETSPLVDATKGTVRVTVTVEQLPPGLSYGDVVRGTVTGRDEDRVTLPWSTMTANKAGPAVWLVDPESKTVALHSITVLRYETGKIVLASGVEPGAMVVSRGAQLLYPGQVVAPVAEEK